MGTKIPQAKHRVMEETKVGTTIKKSRIIQSYACSIYSNTMAKPFSTTMICYFPLIS